ncbi:MAG TPA: PLP-dependent aminotransferase family protein [Vicinamibacterales bacterium]|jgi:GntR family transcriptional regulator/MocR family aminotransferase|nr:PLP-dependent aminotransferase family protein [Vicinamibacterales bacterium]
MGFHVTLLGRGNLSGEIYRRLRETILERRLRPGEPLPPSRALARQLSVSRMTVTVAYDRLEAEGFVVGRVGAGTFVSEHAAPVSASTRERKGGALRPRAVWTGVELPTAFARPARYDFRTGLPDARLFPHRVWRRVMTRTMSRSERAGGVYQDPAGIPHLRAAIARHIAVSRGVRGDADDIIVTNGTQQALDVLVRVLLAPGERIAVEEPGYAPPRHLFASLGLRVVGVPVDEDGLVVQALPSRVRAVYVTPSHQYPLGVRMSLERRHALLAWAERTGAAIIEDDYDSEFRFGDRPLEALQSLDVSGRVAYVGSFSKTMLPTLRVGFVLVPESLRLAARKAKFVTDWHTSVLVQSALAEFIEGGAYARHLRRTNAEYRARHQLIAAVLSRDFASVFQVLPSSAGLHITAMARARSPQQIAAVQARAADEGVAIQILSSFAGRRSKRAGVVLGYGAIASGDIEEGLRRLRRVI